VYSSLQRGGWQRCPHIGPQDRARSDTRVGKTVRWQSGKSYIRPTGLAGGHARRRYEPLTDAFWPVASTDLALVRLWQEHIQQGKITALLYGRSTAAGPNCRGLRCPAKGLPFHRIPCRWCWHVWHSNVSVTPSGCYHCSLNSVVHIITTGSISRTSTTHAGIHERLEQRAGLLLPSVTIGPGAAHICVLAGVTGVLHCSQHLERARSGHRL